MSRQKLFHIYFSKQACECVSEGEMNDQAPDGCDSNEITNDSIVVHHSHGSSCEGKLDGCKKKKSRIQHTD